MPQKKSKPVVQIYLPENLIKSFEYEPTALEVAMSLGSKQAKKAVGVKLEGNSEIKDIRTILRDGSQIQKIVTLDDEDSLEVIRHSTAHVMAEAIQKLWPGTLATIGPVIEDGFYYDFESSFTFSVQDFRKIENKMSEMIRKNTRIEREIWSKKKALRHFKEKGEIFKVEIIQDFPEGEEISVYRQGDWLDLCRGPHLQSTGQIKAFKILSVSGSYWRGHETGPKLQRIYGTAFRNKDELKNYLHYREELKKRDHRKLGKELGLFYFHESSPGSAFFTPKGTIIYNELKKFIREMYLKYNYQEVVTPQIFEIDFFKKSGHYENYIENMYLTQVEKREFALKPMNCPGHCLLFNMEKRSYRDLPWRVADFSRLNRYERSGVMHGLARVRGFVQDDAHIFCSLQQLPDEIKSFKNFLQETYETLGLFDYKVFLSTRPEKRMGEDDIWNQAEGFLEKSLKDLKWDYEVLPGEGAFYGPKLDIVVKDSLKRGWQLGTFQCDFNMPKAFSLKFDGSDNKKHQPILLHRAVLGSIERFMGVYLEHTAGKLPLWLSPDQVCILNLNDRNLAYCRELQEKIENVRLEKKSTLNDDNLKKRIRVSIDDRHEKLGFKIRSAQMNKISYMLIIGDKEMKSHSLSVRLRNGETKQLTEEEFISGLSEEIVHRARKGPWEEKEDESL